MRRIQIYVPGILTFPGEADNWDGRAVTHTHLHSDWRAEKVEYFSTAFLRPVFQRHRAAKLSSMLDRYAGWETHLVGHSNGTDVLLDGLELAGWPAVERLHLVCGACEADFRLNGLNAAIARGAVREVFVYVAMEDRAMRLADTWVGRLLGYGTLGLRGPIGVADSVRDRVHVQEWPTFGHSECWHGGHFPITMANFLA